MFASLAFVFLFGLMGAAVFEKMKLPRIIGMLLVGILIGPYALGLLDPTILSISGDLRKLALMLILLRSTPFSCGTMRVKLGSALSSVSSASACSAVTAVT